MFKRGTASAESRLVERAKQLNKKLPKQLDEETRWDSASSGPGNRMNYFYTLVNVKSTDLDATLLAQQEASMKATLIYNYKTLPEFENFRKRQTELQIYCRDKDGNQITNILISPKEF